MIRSDGLSIRIGRDIIPFQLAVNNQIAELPADFGAGKGIASKSEFHALYFTGSPADFEFQVNATGCQCIFQLIPTLGIRHFRFPCFVDFVLRSVVWAQAFFLDAVFPVSEMEPIFGGKHLADFLVAVAVVFVANGLSIVVHTVENNVAVRMFPVNVSGDDVLCVSDAYSFHVFMGDFQHQRIIIL